MVDDDADDDDEEEVSKNHTIHSDTCVYMGRNYTNVNVKFWQSLDVLHFVGVCAAVETCRKEIKRNLSRRVLLTSPCST